MMLATCACVALLTYLFLLSRRLRESSFDRSKSGTLIPTDEQLLEDGAKWPEIDVLAGTAIAQATGKVYLVTGAAGNAGAQLVKLLHLRGERRIFCLDIMPLPAFLEGLDGIHFRRCDISSSADVSAIFKEVEPDVVFHLGAAIRVWERRSFTPKHSKAVNVDGTRNIIESIQDLPDSSDKILLYCSSTSLVCAPPRLMRIYGNPCLREDLYPLSDDKVLPTHLWRKDNYAKTKRIAEDLVRAANGIKGIRSGALRPGGICGPDDMFIALALRRAVNPSFHNIAENRIDARDLGAGFLYYELAPRERPHEVGGDAFLITGERGPFTTDEFRHMISVLAYRNLRWMPVPALPLYLIGHLVELYCTARYYALLPLTKLLYGTKPSTVPAWMIAQELHLSQPATWDNLCIDLEVDDSRCRKVLGYCNRYSIAQTIRWIVDSIDAEVRSRAEHYAPDDPRSK